jgi:hypothetical protein
MIDRLTTASFRSTSCAFKEMKPIGSVCVPGKK